MIEVEFHWIILGAMSLGLASVHLWSTWFDVRYARQEPFWMGFIAGIATGYLVLYLLPKIGSFPHKTPIIGTDYLLIELRLYLLMLLAMVLYLVMLNLDQPESRWSSVASAFDYGVHGSYSLLLGYVFVEMASDRHVSNGIICTIFALHLLGMNHVLRNLRAGGFDKIGRWIYFCLVLTGAALGLSTELPAPVVHALTAFLAGIILVFVISEELPLHHQNRVSAFLFGICVFVIAAYLVFRLDPHPGY